MVPADHTPDRRPPRKIANQVARSVSRTARQTDLRPRHASRTARASGNAAYRPGRGSKRQQFFTPNRGPTGGRGPVGTKGGPKRLKGALALSALGHAVDDFILRNEQAKREEGYSTDPIPRSLRGPLSSSNVARALGHQTVAVANGPVPAVVHAKPILSDRGSEKIGRLIQNTVRDAIEIPANAPGALYNVGAAGVEAAGGDTSRAKRLYEGLKNTDPIALAIQGRFGEAWHQVGQHPVSSALEVSGVKATLGRAAGKAERLGGASREAEPAVLEGTAVKQRRPYSRDAVTRRRQIAVDKQRTRAAQRFIDKAVEAERRGAHEQAVEFRHKARKLSPVHVSDAHVRRRVDERNDANEQVRRSFRTHAIRRSSKHAVPERKGGHLVSLLAQGIVHPHRADIEAYAQELDVAYHSGLLSPAQRLTNRRTAAAIRTALKSKKLDLAALHETAKRYARGQADAEQALVESGLIDVRQAEKARLIPYAVRRMGASHNGDRIVGPDGRFLSSEAIKAHMAAHGVNPDDIAYLSQSPNARGAKNFYMNTLQRHTIATPFRTGEATRLGTFDTDPQTLVEQAAREANLQAADHGFKSLVNEFGVRRPENGELLTFSTKRSADMFIRDQHAQGARPLRAIRLNPFAGKQSDLEAVLEHVNEGTQAPTSVTKLIDSAINGDDGAGPWAVIHETAANRIQDHLKLQAPMVGLKGLQKVNQAFRNAVLPLSVKWVTGNVVEAAFRTTLAKAGPLSYLTGRRVLAGVDDLAERGVIPRALAEEARARTVGGGHFAMADRTSVHRGSKQFEDSALRPVARALGAMARAPGPRQLGQLWHAYTHFVFSANTLLERQFQTALAGKYVRTMMMSPREIGITQRAVEQAARGLTDTNEQAQMGRFVDRAYGKYGKFNPTERALIAYYTPFIAWSLNAVKFVTSVLPKDHPVATALTVAASNASDEWLKDHGLNLWIEKAAPGWLQGSAPVKGGKVRLGRYLPFGFFSDPAQSSAGVILPQYMGAIMALNGLDWKGDPLVRGKEASQGDKFSAALSSFFEATVPVLGQVQQFATKEGPTGQRLNRQFNPFYPVQNTQQAGRTGDPLLDEFNKFRSGRTQDALVKEFEKFRQGR